MELRCRRMEMWVGGVVGLCRRLDVGDFSEDIKGLRDCGLNNMNMARDRRC